VAAPIPLPMRYASVNSRRQKNHVKIFQAFFIFIQTVMQVCLDNVMAGNIKIVFSQKGVMLYINFSDSFA
jgi:hypothetical protein